MIKIWRPKISYLSHEHELVMRPKIIILYWPLGLWDTTANAGAVFLVEAKCSENEDAHDFETNFDPDANWNPNLQNA